MRRKKNAQKKITHWDLSVLIVVISFVSLNFTVDLVCSENLFVFWTENSKMKGSPTIYCRQTKTRIATDIATIQKRTMICQKPTENRVEFFECILNLTPLTTERKMRDMKRARELDRPNQTRNGWTTNWWYSCISQSSCTSVFKTHTRYSIH